MGIDQRKRVRTAARALTTMHGAALVLASGCAGSVEPGPPAPRSGAGVYATGSGAARSLAGLAPPTLHRLRVDEVQNTLGDLLGAPLPKGVALEPDTALKGFTSIGASELTIANTTAEKLERAALESTRALFADARRRRDLVGCEPAHVSDPCAQAFVLRFGERAWRRPLAPEEADAMRALATRLEGTLGDVWQALAYTCAAYLQSPYFAFRVERGEPDPEGRAPLRLDGHELASRLSYLLSRSMPDDGLREAAATGKLMEVEGVRAEAERLMAAPRFRDALRRFFSEQLALDRIDAMSKDASVFPGFDARLRKSMRADLELRFDDLVFAQRGDYRDLLDGRTAFVDAALAKLYGVAEPPAGSTRKVTLPRGAGRAGILGSAGLLALHATTSDTSPTRRGKFIRTQILCQEIPPPPPGANVTFADEVDARPQTMRSRLAVHRALPECASCHARVDPLGLAFEHFDGVGGYRREDRGMAIDASGELDGAHFDGPEALMALLKVHPDSAHCIARQLLRFALGRQEAPEAAPHVDALAAQFREGGYRLPALMLALVTSDAFRYAALPDASEEAAPEAAVEGP